MKQIARLGLIGVAALASAPSFARSGGSFVGAGDLPGGLFQSYTFAASADGSVTVGSGHMGLGPDPNQPTAAQCTAVLGIRPLPGLLFSDRNSRATSVSGDGRVICGGIWDDLESRPFVWSQGGGATILTAPTSELILGSALLGLSHDGAVAVGYVSSWDNSQSTGRAMRWTASEGLQFIPGLDAPGEHNQAVAVSADGSVVMGTASTDDGRYEPFRWSETGGMERMGILPSFQSHWVQSGTPDARVMVGFGYLPNAQYDIQPFRWTSTNGLELLSTLSDAPWGRAYSVSADGSRIVGELGNRAAIWLGSHHSLRLSDYMTQLGITGFADWQLWAAYGISADGHTIVGNGTNPQGETEGFIVTLPPHCPGDADRDGAVSFADISAILTHWQGFGPQGDANDDFIVDFNDITETLTNWRGECP